MDDLVKQTSAAVIVTYNRLELLKKCIVSIREQTEKPDKIIVVNNSSTDGTKDWLAGEKHLLVITQPNSGGAGGFYTGIKTAYELGYDWIWCMDDDGNPAKDCLEKLICFTTQNPVFKVIGSTVVSSKDPQRLSFYTPIFSSGKNISSTILLENIIQASKNNVYEGYASFFNGILINREVVEKVGLPKKELFIWGDESEYYRRIRLYGYKSITLLNALFYHPENKWNFGKSFLGKDTFDGKLDWKAYCYFRNSGYFSKEYRFYNIKYIIAQILFFICKGFNIKAIFFFLKAYYDGINENFTKELPY